MFDLLADELVVLGIGGAVLVAAGCTITKLSPITVQLIVFLLGVAMLAVALVEIVSRR